MNRWDFLHGFFLGEPTWFKLVALILVVAVALAGFAL
jgi:hypothetical protein